MDVKETIEEQLTFLWRDIASCLELLYGNVRVFGEQDHVPVVVTHGRRGIAAVQIQKSNKQATAVMEVECFGGDR